MTCVSGRFSFVHTHLVLYGTRVYRRDAAFGGKNESDVTLFFTLFF